MAAIHVRDVNEHTLTTLKVRAARSGQSLQAYLRNLLDDEARVLTVEEAVDEARSIAERSQVTSQDVLRAVAETRRARE